MPSLPPLTSNRVPFVLAVLSAAVLSACSKGDVGGAVVTPPPPARAGWRWMNPISEGASLTGVWGAAPDNFFATAQDGAVLRFDGAAWRRTATPATGLLSGIWGSATDNVVAVGAGGMILRFNGSSWAVEASGTDLALRDVWGSSATDIFAVGDQRMVLHYDGGTWAPMTVPLGPAQALYSVWGSGPANVYVAGIGKDLLRYDGTAWQEIATPATFALNAVWGLDANDVFAVGGNGAVIHWDGASWSVIDATGTGAIFQTVWGTASNDVCAMGLSGQAFHWDGAAWSPIDLYTDKSISRVFGVGGRVVAVGGGGTIFERTADAWRPAAGGTATDFEEVWVAPGGAEAFAVGDFGTIMHLRDGTWSRMESGTWNNLRSVRGLSASDVFAAGEQGTILHFDGASWTPLASNVSDNLWDVWAWSGDLAWAVGDHGTVLRYDGASWTPLDAGHATDSFYSAWGSSPDNVYLTGSRSTAVKWVGTGFKAVTIDPVNIHNFHDVFGTGPNDVFIATEYLGPARASMSAPQHAGGLIFHYDGTAWLPAYQDPTHDVLGVWRADASHGAACGDASTVLVDGGDGAWTRTWDLKNLPFYVRSVYGRSMDNIFVVGDNGTIARYGR